MIACLGETTGLDALQTVLQVMKSSPEGLQILSDKPRINSRTVDLDALGKLPVDTFGYAYKKFLDDNVRIGLKVHSHSLSLSVCEHLINIRTVCVLSIYLFMEQNVTPDTRMSVKFLKDPELMYVMTRYRECHDLIHTVLGMPTNMLGEVTVKWIEAINIGLPMCYGGAVFGAMRLRPK